MSSPRISPGKCCLFPSDEDEEEEEEEEDMEDEGEDSDNNTPTTQRIKNNVCHRT